MNPNMLTIPMGPTGPVPEQTIDVTPVGTGSAPTPSSAALLGWLAIGFFVFYLYKHHGHHHGGLL